MNAPAWLTGTEWCGPIRRCGTLRCAMDMATPRSCHGRPVSLVSGDSIDR
jgi:hypothetical protein